MNILFILPDYSGNGGAETVIKLVCEELKKKHISCRIYIAAKHKTNRSKTQNSSWLEKANYSRHAFNTKINNLNRYLHSLKIRDIINQYDIDRIITVDGRGIRLAKLAVKKIKKNILIFTWAHSNIQQVKENSFFRQADHHLTISKKISLQIEEMGVNKDDITTVYNPVPQQEITIPYSSVNLLFIGRLRENPKQFSTILSALSKAHGDWALHVFGDGPDSDLYKLRAKELGIDNKIYFYGFVEDPWRYIINKIGSIGSLLLSSRTEGFPMVLCEAMSYGIYCISSDCETGPNEIIKAGVNGQLFDVGDDERLSFHIQNIIDKKIFIDHDKIKKSIEHLYTDAYTDNLIQAIKSPHHTIA